MKQHITPDDLATLTESQKMNLRDMWMPEVNTLACASVCKCVVNDIYENIVFVIGSIIIPEGSNTPVLGRLGPADEIMIDDELPDQNNEEEVSGEIPKACDENYVDEISEFEYFEPDHYFSKKDCLPLLSIGQMLEMLSRLKYGQHGLPSHCRR